MAAVLKKENGIMAKRHLSKRELYQKIEQVRKLNIASGYIPFSTMAVFHNYVLWKEQQWQQERLTEYNQMVAVYYEKLLGEEITLSSIKERVEQELDNDAYRSMVEVQTVSKETGNRFLDEMQKKVGVADERIREYGRMYFAVHYNALKDIGCTEEEIESNKKAVSKHFGLFQLSNGPVMEKWKRELLEEVGICIQVPEIK